jgi:hypothetical protein
MTYFIVEKIWIKIQKNFTLINKILDRSMVMSINEFLIQLKHLNEKLSIDMNNKINFIFSMRNLMI